MYTKISTNSFLMSKSDFVLIGAGFGRTGTSSLRDALDILGFKCYHMSRVIKNPSDVALWAELGKAKNELKHQKLKQCKMNSKNLFEKWEECKLDMSKFSFTFDDLLVKNGYKAIVDFPGSPYYQELMEYYPNAKILLSVRSTDEKWYNSVMTTIFPVSQMLQRNLFKIFFYLRGAKRKKEMNNNCFWDLLFDSKMTDKSLVLQRYNNWSESVIKYVKNKRNSKDLLVFNVKKHGWKELCQFLEVPIPKNVSSFPHSNEAKEKQRVLKYGTIAANVFDFVIYGGLIVLIAYFVRMFV